MLINISELQWKIKCLSIKLSTDLKNASSYRIKKKVKTSGDAEISLELNL